jgi:maleylpyruvate isomerase
MTSDDAAPTADLAAMRAAHAELIADLRATDFDPAAPSVLPDWTIGHVLSHIARNADSFTGMFEAAARCETRAQYPGGYEQRLRDIEAGAPRSQAALVDDVTDACTRLEAVCDAASDETWRTAHGRVTNGEVALAELPSRRRKEVVVHHRDLGLAYSARDWPDDFVDDELPRVLETLSLRLPDGVTVRLEDADTGAALTDGDAVVRAPRADLLDWLTGRGTIEGAPPLRPW